MKILLIRSNAFTGTEIKNTLLNLGHSVYDVNRPDQISISEINNQGKCNIYFFSAHISEFDKLFFLSTPFKESTLLSYKDNVFAYCELDATIISALHYHFSKVLNSGLTTMSRSLLNEYFLAFFFKNIGWEFHNSIFTINKHLYIKNNTQYNLIISKVNYYFHPYYDVYFKNYDKIENLINKTQNEMCNKKIDILNVLFVLENESLQIINISQYFQNISNEILLKSFKEII